MRNLNEQNLTEAVLARVRGAKNPRIRQISEALVRHLHAFIREVEPTEAEWLAAIQFLTRTGQMSTEHRHEFILLSDTLGVSMLVDAINHRTPSGGTESTILGPYYVPPPEAALGADISGPLEGTPMFCEGEVRALDGTPLANAPIDVWHTDDDGTYDVQQLEKIGGLAGRARFRTGKDGRFYFWSVRPAPYPVPHDGTVGLMLAAQGRHPFRPAHTHFLIDAPGYEKLVTHVFAEGDEYLDSDVVFGVKDSLIRTYEIKPPGKAPDGKDMKEPYAYFRYDFVLKPLTKTKERAEAGV